jgi:hypothetical protein
MVHAHKVDPQAPNGLKMTYYSQADCLTITQNKWNWKCGECGKVYLNRWQAQDCCIKSVQLNDGEKKA